MALATSPPSSPRLLGAARPRVELRPAYVESYGWAAVELMACAGKRLRPWQVDACELMMAVNADGRWACPEYCEWVGRQNGKGVILEARALAGLFLFGEDLISWSAHEYKTAMEAFRRVRTLVRRLGTQFNPKDPNLLHVPFGGDVWVPVKINNTNGEEGFERLDTEQRLRFIARSKGSGRGFTAGTNLVDETFAYTFEQQDALAPTTLAVDNEQTVYTSTPPLSGTTGEVMYALRERAEAGDPELGYRDWGIGGWLDELDGVDRGGPNEKPPVDVDDPQLWASAYPSLGNPMRLDKLQKLRRKLGRTRYAREALCVWPRRAVSGSDVINKATWAERGDPTSRPGPGSGLVFAIDASPGGRSAAIASGARREDGRLHGKIVDYRPQTGWVVDRVKDLQRRFVPRKWVLDPAGPAGALLADLQKAGIELEYVTGREMAQACGALVNDLTEDRVAHCDQGALNDAVDQATPRTSGSAWQWDRKDPTGDICPLVAYTAALHGFRLYGETEEVEPWAEWA